MILSSDYCLFFFVRLLREAVLSIACQMGDQDSLNEASRIFEQWLGGRYTT